MNGPDHYREAERLLEEAGSCEQPDSRAMWYLELAKLHAALAQVAATALTSDSREWVEVAGRRFSSTSPVPPRACCDLTPEEGLQPLSLQRTNTAGAASHRMCGIRVHLTGLRCTSFHRLKAAAISTQFFTQRGSAAELR